MPSLCQVFYILYLHPPNYPWRWGLYFKKLNKIIRDRLRKMRYREFG